jgi:hypothetical protein
MVAFDGRLHGRYSLDDGDTWQEIPGSFPLAGLTAPGIGVSAYNGTGAEVGSFEYFHVGEPDLPPPPPCDDPYTPEAGYTMLFDGTDSSLANWKYAGGGSFVREDCTIRSVGAFGLLYTEQEFDAPYSLKLEWMMPGDDNSGVFVGFPDTGTNTDQTSISQGEEIQIDPTDNPAQTTGAIYLEQAADAAARDAALNPPGQWNAYEIVVREDRIVVYLNGAKINEWVDDDPNVDLATGHIGLQTHGAGDDVYFRNVRIRDLTPPPTGDPTTVNPGNASPGNVSPGGVDPGDDPPASRPVLKIRGGKVDADRRRRRAAIRMSCPEGSTTCAGAVRMRVAKKTIGTGRFRVAAGATKTIRVKLNRRARRLLAERRRVMTTLTITYNDGRTKRVRLRLTR